jgi:hypothetical protein
MKVPAVITDPPEVKDFLYLIKAGLSPALQPAPGDATYR